MVCAIYSSNVSARQLHANAGLIDVCSAMTINRELHRAGFPFTHAKGSSPLGQVPHSSPPVGMEERKSLPGRCIFNKQTSPRRTARWWRGTAAGIGAFARTGMLRVSASCIIYHAQCLFLLFTAHGHLSREKRLSSP